MIFAGIDEQFTKDRLETLKRVQFENTRRKLREDAGDQMDTLLVTEDPRDVIHSRMDDVEGADETESLVEESKVPEGSRGFHAPRRS